MKSIFILGASRLQIPAIKKAKEKGLYVYVLDYDPNAVGISFADKFLEISTIDKEEVLKAALTYKPDYIITSTSDMPIRTVSWVCEKLEKATDISYDGAIVATDKIAMRRCMKENNVPIPIFYEINNYDELVKVSELFPERFILKPSDNAASRGVVLVDKEKKPAYPELYDYCTNFSRSGKLLAEEYMEGPEVSVESYSINGEPHIITITDKIVSEIPFFVELGHTEPSRLPLNQQDDIRKVAEAAIKAIGMQNGPTHTEIKVTPSGAKLVEIAARLGGDFITSRLVPLSTGVDMIECSFATLLGEEVKYQRTSDNGAAIRFIHGDTGVIKGIDGIDKALKMPGIQEIELYKKVGDSIKKPENSSDRIGHIIASGKDAYDAAKNAEAALETIKVIYDKI
ncbi:MAG: ATP-grasp domain-containing protein [Lachnospiraceae bacterium]|nr:ATP-grasp domain-containing protein [Lachnospiraceae bacterium]